MKRLTLITAMLVVFGGCHIKEIRAQSPGPNEMLEVDITKLSQSELIAFRNIKVKMSKSKDITGVIADMTPEQITKYGQIGKAFGTAFKECWSTVSDDAEQFGQSDAGKVTMFLIAWKIMAKDTIQVSETLVGYLFGGVIFLVLIPVWVYLFRKNCCIIPRLKTKESTGYFPWQYKKEYHAPDKKEEFGDGVREVCYVIALILLLTGASLVMFAG